MPSPADGDGVTDGVQLTRSEVSELDISRETESVPSVVNVRPLLDCDDDSEFSTDISLVDD